MITIVETILMHYFFAKIKIRWDKIMRIDYVINELLEKIEYTDILLEMSKLKNLTRKP